MKNNNRLSIEVIPQEFISGSSEYTVTVNITNNSSDVIYALDISTNLSVGREISKSEDVENSTINILEEKKRKLIKELEEQVKFAFEKYRIKKAYLFEKTIYILALSIEAYAFAFSRKKTSIMLPIWTKEVFKIEDWEDVNKLEEEIISSLDDESFLKKSFYINKQKLKRILDRIGMQNNYENLSSGVKLGSGESISFPFVFKAPHLLRAKKSDIQFKVTYRLNDKEQQTISSVHRKINIFPSAFAVPTGGMIGAASGYFIKYTLLTKDSLMNWRTLFGSILFGLVISLITSRKPETSKSITVEDFVGGFIVGALAGLFSEAFINKLQALIS